MSQTPATSSDAGSILPRHRLVTVQQDGPPRELAVRPFRIFGDMDAINAILPKLQPFLADLAKGNYLGALMQAGEPCLALVALSTRLPAADIVALDSEDQLALVTATFEVNVDFFVHRLTPAITALVASLLPAPTTTIPGAAPTFQDMTAPAPEVIPDATPNSSGPTPPAS